MLCELVVCLGFTVFADDWCLNLMLGYFVNGYVKVGVCLCFVVVVYYLCLDLMLCCVVIGYVKLTCVFVLPCCW